ncbi:MAG: PIN domain nuclease [Aquisalimonadaceae bacterium]
MVLVDSSVWIDYFNGTDNPAPATLDDLLSSTIVGVGDLILAEVLQGFRSDTDYLTARSLLLDLDLHVLGGVDLAQKAADHFRTLRKQGITVRKTVDCIIATYCIEHQIPLLYSDRDFRPFVQHLGLQPVLDFPL